jgi:hypothetical protein
MGADLIALTVIVVIITAGGLFIVSRPVTPSRRTEQLERIARSLERLEHVHGIAADEWRAVLHETPPAADVAIPVDPPQTGGDDARWVHEHQQAVVETLDATPSREPVRGRLVTEYPVGQPIWIYGVTEGSLHPGVIVHRFTLTEDEDEHAWQYVIQYRTPIGNLLALRDGFGLSETAEGPINRWLCSEPA